MQYIRDRAFSGGYEEETSSGRWKYLLIIVLLLLGGVAYKEWPLPLQLLGLSSPAKSQPTSNPKPVPTDQTTSAPVASPPPTPLPTEPAATKSDQPQASANPDESSSARKAEAKNVEAEKTEAKTDEATNEAKTGGPNEHAPALKTLDANSAQAHPAASPAKLPAGSETILLPSDAAAGRSAVDGTQELQLGMRYLEGRREPRNTRLAATWLWRAVAKQNSQASMLLADLYARGDGVSKSCDQAKVLLDAALKKGQPEAAVKLRDLGTWGCR